MKYINSYKLFEGVGGDIIEDDIIEYLKDRALFISDLGYNANARAYVTYGHYDKITYDIHIGKKLQIAQFDINDKNIIKLDEISKELEKINKLNSECISLIKGGIKMGLYLCHYELTLSSHFSGIIRFIRNKDGSQLDPDYTYYSED